ncbi:FkbM family methyltransferase [Candidatus Nitrosopelagicus sp.]|nr:FkbM family methyltransferase [Candidatus Nitrosopelagicus sp.]
MKKIISKLYVNISRKLSRGKGLGKKYGIVNSTVNKIESSLKSDTADVWAGKMFLHPNDGLKLSIRGFHDEEEAMMVKNNIKKDEIVVDLGAHIGYYTLMMAKLVGQDGKVFAFEPEPRNLELLNKNIKINSYKNIEVVPKAVSDIDEECTLFVGQESFGANKIFKPKKTDTQEFEEIKTRTIRLDDFFEELGFLKKISFIKMDIEGSEVRALQGMKNILEFNENLKIFTEINRDALEDNNSNFRNMLELLGRYNFKFYISTKKESEWKKIEIYNFEELMKNDSVMNVLCKKN